MNKMNKNTPKHVGVFLLTKCHIYGIFLCLLGDLWAQIVRNFLIGITLF